MINGICRINDTNSLVKVPSLPNLCYRAVLPVPRFSSGNELDLTRRCGKNLAVEGCSFWVIFGKTTSVKVQDNCV